MNERTARPNSVGFIGILSERLWNTTINDTNAAMKVNDSQIKDATNGCLGFAATVDKSFGSNARPHSGQRGSVRFSSE